MDDNDIDHRSAALSLIALLVLTAERAWGITRRAALRIKPLVTPPRALRVDAGGPLYSGVLVIDRNDVIFGVVVQTGYDPTSSSPASAFARPAQAPTSPSTALDRLRQQQLHAHELFGDRQGKLPSWAETDDDYGGGPWGR